MTSDEIVMLVAIAKQLANCAPYDREMGDCTLCDAWDFGVTSEAERVPKHDADCPYRMAVELMG